MNLFSIRIQSENFMINKKNSLENLNPRELFLRTSYRILKLKLKRIRIITKFVNHLLVVWHVVNLARTRAELWGIIHKKRDFPYEDYTSYL